MTKHTSDALQRADRTLVWACLLVASFSAGILFGQNAPSTEQVAMAAPKSAPKVVRLVHDQMQVAPRFDRVTVVAADGTTNVMSATPVSFVSAPTTLAAPDSPLAKAPSAAELALERILEDQRCLAEAMYYEARGEGKEGQEAIAEVVFHRMHAPGYPRTICGVVYQGADRRSGCQFSFACDGELLQPKSSSAWARARMLAARIMAGIVRLGDITGDAIAFHAADIQPDWADQMERTIQIGNHIFYRAAPRTKSS